MKLKIQAEVSAMVEKEIEASCLEDGLAKGRGLGFEDFLLLRSDVESWTDSERVKIIGATDPKVTK
jgi:hypothetical protein